MAFGVYSRTRMLLFITLAALYIVAVQRWFFVCPPHHATAVKIGFDCRGDAYDDWYADY